MAEKILCLPRKKLPTDILKPQIAYKTSWEDALSLIRNGSCLFLSREKAEVDTTYKQIVPYVIIRNIRGDILCYEKNEDEKSRSPSCCFGIWKHIRKEDFGEKAKKSRINDAVHSVIKRQLKNELGILEDSCNCTFLGIVNAEESPEGQVYLGLVYEHYLSPHGIIQLGEGLSRPRWIPLDALSECIADFEPWSMLARELLE